MVLAAGLGTRMRPLTDNKPKALVEVGGKALIDHMLDRLAVAGVTRAVVNVHAFAEQIEAHLKRRTDLEILISDERAARLETGGGVKKARLLLGEAPIWVANSDYLWRDGRAALNLLAEAWEPDVMDACLIVVPKARTLGFDTPGDFFMDADGALAHRGAEPVAPLHCFGIEILDPRRVYEQPQTAFSMFQVWMALASEGRLRGVTPDGFWMQIGDPAALAVAQARLAVAR
ncbi:MAG: nucleotidyltransferase family protein [Pseudomonadota bacterium]|nr:nucleotidyltransferase family protein [Pseudomonadota bacterium]